MADVLAERASLRLSLLPPDNAFDGSLPARAGDHVLNAELANAKARPAAVLVPVVAHRGGATVLLTQRAVALRDHSGQIAFPGGKIDAADASPLAAALREAEEEIGLDARHIEPLGWLDPYQTGTGYRILPLLARVTPGFSLRIDPREVDAAFEVPLDFLMTPENHLRHSRQWAGRKRFYYAMPWGERYIWGATAGILRNLYERLYR